MEEMNQQEFVDLLISTEVWDERMAHKWEDIVNKLSCYYYYLAEEIEKKNFLRPLIITGKKVTNFLHIFMIKNIMIKEVISWNIVTISIFSKMVLDTILTFLPLTGKQRRKNSIISARWEPK